MKDIINKIKVFLGIDVIKENKPVSNEYVHFIQRFSRRSWHQYCF